MKNHHIYGVQITGKCICESKKLNQDIFAHAPRQKSPLGSYHHPQAEENYSTLPGSVFLNIYSSHQKGGEKLRCYSCLLLILTLHFINIAFDYI